MDTLITQAVDQRQVLGPGYLAQIAGHVAAAPFARALIEVDEPLWGSFWQFDVIAPGYRLPAVELALLRAIRLDQHWPEDTVVEQFLADLRQAILAPQAAIWTLKLAEVPWIIFATESDHKPAEDQAFITVVWYCASTGQVHAGYRATATMMNFTKTEAVAQRATVFKQQETVFEANPDWLEAAVVSTETEVSSLAAKLDQAILKFRAEMKRRSSR
jgi:hypothetical protein